LFGLIPTKLEDVLEKLFAKALWHPLTEIRLIQFLFHKYRIYEVAKAIREKKDALEV